MRTFGSILERLHSKRKPPSYDCGQGPDLLRSSILQNLKRILNSRASTSQACEGYGIPDLTQIVDSVPEGAFAIERALEQCIRQYESILAHCQ